MTEKKGFEFPILPDKEFLEQEKDMMMLDRKKLEQNVVDSIIEKKDNRYIKRNIKSLS
jgi:hypothetical protein